MEAAKSEIRSLLDVLENAGFTLMYYQSSGTSSCIEISIKSSGVKNAYDHFEKEKAKTGSLCTLLENRHYRVKKCEMNKDIASGYGGTFFLEIDPPCTETT